jgi:release factor glutamine methyltransferase
MGIKIQTIKDIRFYLTRELLGTYPSAEIRAITNIIIRHVLETVRPHHAYMNDALVDNEQASKIINIAGELKSGKPIQYILGETIFYDCTIMLNSSTLIPRPETEELVHHLIHENRGYKGNIIDFCTGSGCIAIAIALNLPGSTVTGTDISGEALMLAEENARLNNVKITFLKDDVLNPETDQFEKAGLIVSNPPYIRNSEKLQMSKNVLDFEPHSALFVEDSDPLIFYKGILSKAVRILDNRGKIYFEINEMLGKSMIQLLDSYGYGHIKILNDINGKERIIKGIKYAG